MRRRSVFTVLAALLVIGMASVAFAQAQGGGGNGGGGGRGNRGQRGNFDPAQMRERMMTQIKEQLGATDDEWKVLEPKIEKVMDAQRNGQGGRGGFGGRGGRGGQGGNQANQQPQTDVAKAMQELRTALEDKATPAADITAKLAAYRDARTKARTDLASAQKELKDVLTARQEAILVTRGMLE